jgi:hypothetical protein
MKRKIFDLLVLLLSTTAAFAQYTNTPNIGLKVPIRGSNNWDIPLYYDWTMIDNMLGGQTPLPNGLQVIGPVSMPGFTFTSSQIVTGLGYQPLNPTNNLSDVNNAATALANLGGIGANSYQGTWSSSTSYTRSAIVLYNGISYISLQTGNVNNEPDTSPSYWGALGSVVPTGSNSTLGILKCDGTTASCPSGTISVIGGGGSTGLQIEHTFSSAGTYNYNHALNDEYPIYQCYSLSGATAFSASPVDANNLAISVNAASTILCSFLPTHQLGADFSFTITPSSLNYTISGGGTQTPTVAIAQSAINGYTGTVTYSVSGLPTGMTGAFSPTTISGSGSSTLTLSFASSFTPGTYTYTVSATDGTITHTNPGSITVIAAGSGDFSFTITPSTYTFTPTMEGTQTPTFAIAQTAISGYAGTVTYSTTGLASGMSSGYSPSTITGTGSSTLSVSFPATQAAGLTTITASGTDGTLTHTNPLALTISDINSGLLDGWQMNEGTGLTFFDATSNANNLTVGSGCGSWGTVTGIGTAFSFNGACLGALGTNDTLTNFDGTAPFSISAWIEWTNSTGNWEVIAENLNGPYESTGKGIFWSKNNSEHLYVQIMNSSANLITLGSPSTTLAPNTLYFVVLTYDGSKTAAGTIQYVNATALSPNVITNSLAGTIASATPFTFAGPNAADTNAANYYHQGPQAFVRVYNRVLTSSDITAMYAAGPR